jgi:ribonuclease HII
MSLVFKAGERSFKASEVMWAKQELINAVVEQALLNQTEAFIDMIIDTYRPEEITRASINEILRGVKDSAADFLVDVVGDFERSIKQRLEEVGYGAAVTGFKYDLAGNVTDIEVDVSVS